MFRAICVVLAVWFVTYVGGRLDRLESTVDGVKFSVTCIELGGAVVANHAGEFNRSCVRNGEPWISWRV